MPNIRGRNKSNAEHLRRGPRQLQLGQGGMVQRLHARNAKDRP